MAATAVRRGWTMMVRWLMMMVRWLIRLIIARWRDVARRSGAVGRVNMVNGARCGPASFWVDYADDGWQALTRDDQRDRPRQDE